MLSGRGKFQTRRVVDGDLEISTSGATDDERLREWIHESRAVLPRLRAMVRNGDRRPAPLAVVVEELRQRVEELERELASLRRDLAGAWPRPRRAAQPSRSRHEIATRRRV